MAEVMTMSGDYMNNDVNHVPYDYVPEEDSQTHKNHNNAIMWEDATLEARKDGEANETIHKEGCAALPRQPLNKFVSPGPLHSLAVLTHLDLSNNLPENVDHDLPSLEGFKQPPNLSGGLSRQYDDSQVLLSKGPFLPERNLSKESSPMKSQSSSSFVNAIPAASNQSSPTSSCSDHHHALPRDPQSPTRVENGVERHVRASTPSKGGKQQCVLMRENLIYEPRLKDDTSEVLTNSEASNKPRTYRKKIKIKAPVPKQNVGSSVTKSKEGSVTGGHTMSVAQHKPEIHHHDHTAEAQLGHENGSLKTKGGNLSKKLAMLKARLEHEAQNHDMDDPHIDIKANDDCNAPVVTHSEYSIDVPTFQGSSYGECSSNELRTFIPNEEKAGAIASWTDSSCDGAAMKRTRMPFGQTSMPLSNSIRNINVVDKISDLSATHTRETSAKSVDDSENRVSWKDELQKPDDFASGSFGKPWSNSGNETENLDSRDFKVHEICVPTTLTQEVSCDSKPVSAQDLSSSWNQSEHTRVRDIQVRSTPQVIKNKRKDLMYGASEGTGEDEEPRLERRHEHAHDAFSTTDPQTALVTTSTNMNEQDQMTQRMDNPTECCSPTSGVDGQSYNGSNGSLYYPPFRGPYAKAGELPDPSFSKMDEYSNGTQANVIPAQSGQSYHHCDDPRSPKSIKSGKLFLSSTPPPPEGNSKLYERNSLSSEKINSILSYLGHVQESNLQENYRLLHKSKLSSSHSPNTSQSPRTVLEHEDSVSVADSSFTTTFTNLSNPDSSAYTRDGDEHHQGRSPAVTLFEGVRKKIQQYKDKISSQESQIAKFQMQFEDIRKESDQLLSLEREKFTKELEKQAAEYKAAVQHHLSLNEKMVQDKENLSQKCCDLSQNLKAAENKFEEKLKAFKDHATQDVKKQKELWVAGEKPKREAWKDKKLKEIKEITIKGLEPHIEGIVEKHKQEIQRLETRFADDTQKKLELQVIQHRQELSELRERLLKDRDSLVEKERMAALQRMNEVAEKYEQQAMQLRLKISGDMANELARVEEGQRKDKHDAHELLSRFQKEATEREDSLRQGLEKAMQDAILKRENEIDCLKAELLKQRNDWNAALDDKLQPEIAAREIEIQEKCIKERNQQIEMIIEKMEAEKDEAIEKHQKGLLMKVEKLMEEKLDFMKRIKDVESKCASLCNLSLKAKQKAETELEAKNAELESVERELSCQHDLVTHLKLQLEQEKGNTKLQIQNWESKLRREQDLLQSAVWEIEKCNEEIQKIKSRKVEELAEVEAHVRHAIDNKDLVIQELKEELLTVKEQMRHTEMLL